MGGPLRGRPFALLLLLVAAGCGDAPRPDAAILLLVDTLRADHLGAMGHERPTTPHIDRLAAKGVLFERAVSFSSWTLPSAAALFSGTFPTRREFDGTLQRSLVKSLRDAGFRTAAFTEGGFVSHHFGFDRGFEVYADADTVVRIGVSPRASPEPVGTEATFAAASAWLRDHAQEPFFLLVHTYEVHVPYYRQRFSRRLPRGALKPAVDMVEVRRIQSGEIRVGDRERAYLEALYDGGVAVADRAIGELLALVDALGIADSTLVVVTSDHGEDLGDRYPHYAAEHGHSLYDELVRVPLVVRDPSLTATGRRVTAQVRSVDVLPTILDRLGVEVDRSDGRSLAPLLRGDESAQRVALSHVKRHGPERVAASLGGLKLIRNLGTDPSQPPVDPDAPPREVYDLRDDPLETRNVSGERPDAEAALDAALDEWMERNAEQGWADFGSRTGLPRDLYLQLRELGYFP